MSDTDETTTLRIEEMDPTLQMPPINPLDKYSKDQLDLLVTLSNFVLNVIETDISQLNIFNIRIIVTNVSSFYIDLKRYDPLLSILRIGTVKQQLESLIEYTLRLLKYVDDKCEGSNLAFMEAFKEGDLNIKKCRQFCKEIRSVLETGIGEQ